MSHPVQSGRPGSTPPDRTVTEPAFMAPAAAVSSGVERLGDRGSGFRPYPTASTRTRLSPATPASRAASSRRRGRQAAPIPATVWVPDPGSVVDPAAVWPTVILRQIVAAFSRPGDEVVLTPWPTHTDTSTGLVEDETRSSAADGAPWSVPSEEFDDAIDTVTGLRRRPRVVELDAGRAIDFLAREVTGSRPTDDETAAVSPGGTAELMVTSMPPHPAVARNVDDVALLAARELRFGGILVVLTHCHFDGHVDGGELRDPSGPMIAAGQNADLLYLQHIVAVHLPVRDLRSATTYPDPTTAPVGSGSEVAAPGDTRPGSSDRSPQRPAPHRRVHSDVLAFAQPREHRSPERRPPNAADPG